MTTARRTATFAAAVAGLLAPLWIAGCDNACPTEAPQVSAVPTCSGMKPTGTLTIQIRICPTCNQTAAECQVVPPGVDGIIQLDPIVQACDPSGSCPPACNLNALSCSFPSPGAGNYTVLVADPAGGTPIQRDFIVAAGGSSDSCSL